MNELRHFFWKTYRNLKHVKSLSFSVTKPFFCRMGFHKIRRGFGWGNGSRYDICLKCNWCKWYKDEIGLKILNVELMRLKKK